MDDAFLKTGAVAKFFNVTVRTIKNWRQSGKLIPIAVNERGHFLYSLSQLEELKKFGLTNKKTLQNQNKSICDQNNSSSSKAEVAPQIQSNSAEDNSEVTLAVSNNSNKKFGKILQAKPTNALTSTSGKNVTPNLIGNAEIICNDVQIFIEQFSQINLNVQTYKVLDVCILKLTKNFPYGKKVTDEALILHKDITISTDDYMKMTGLKDRKQAYNQLKDAMNTLYRISFKWDEKIFVKNKETVVHYNLRLAEAMKSTSSTDVIKNIFERGSVTLSLSIQMARFFTTAYIMPYPYNLLTVNSHKNPHSYFIGRKLSLHYNMNVGKSNANRIAVATLIATLPELPKYNEIPKRQGQVTKRIIQPFERDLIALQDTYKILKEWHYCNPHGEPLTEEQILRYNYSTWIEWLIEFSFEDYPDQTERIYKMKLRKK